MYIRCKFEISRLQDAFLSKINDINNLIFNDFKPLFISTL